MKTKIIAIKLAALILLTLVNSNALASNISYVLAARQADLLKTQERIADMVANVNTTAFKAEHDIYSELSIIPENEKNISFSKINQTSRDNTQGSLKVTGRPLDVAINGPGYFMIETPRGTRFTRVGNLKINSKGSLTTQQGYLVVGPGGGQVEFAERDINITIRENGLVTAKLEERGRIGVFTFEDDMLLTRESQGIYRTDQLPLATKKSKIVQGMLEESNVNSITAMTELINVSRGIERTKNMQKDFHSSQMNAIRSLAGQ